MNSAIFVAVCDQNFGNSTCVQSGRYRGGRMAGKKDYDATKNVPEGEPTQVLPKGTKTGLPKRRDVFAALEKVVRKPAK
jgi:hypothetical protein